MSKYTTELRYICEAAAGLTESKGYNSIDEIIAASWDKVFDFSFPIWDPAYKEALCSKIIRHYYTREICAETVARWKLFVRSKMELEMDRINELYKTTVLQINPLYDVDLTRTHTTTNRGTQETNGVSEIETRSSGSTTGTNTSTGETTASSSAESESNTESSGTSANSGTSGSTTTASNNSKFSDTPQGAITGLEEGSYLTTATIEGASTTASGENESTGSSSSSGSTTTTSSNSDTTTTETSGSTTGSSTSSGTETGTSSSTINIHNLEDYIEHVTGKQGSTLYGTMIRDFRETIICIDEMVIDMLADCFMSIY